MTGPVFGTHHLDPLDNDLIANYQQGGEPIGERIEQGAEAADLAGGSGDLAVEIVGEPADHQQDDRPDVGMGHEDQPEEHRNTEQSCKGEQVGDREDAVGLNLCLLHAHGSTLTL